MISIIMPSLNVQPYIEKCLSSVCGQTYKNLEIICVDAGSTDGTLEMLKEKASKDSRIIVLESDRKSYGYQMNLGLRYAKGEYIGIVETDDYIDPEMYQSLYQIIERTHADFVKGSFRCFAESERGSVFEKIENPIANELGVKLVDLNVNPEFRLIDRNHIWSALYNRQFLLDNDIWFHETDGASFQDASFSMMVGLAAQTCVYDTNAYYNYRVDRAESSVKSDKKWKCICDEFDFVNQYIKSRGITYECLKQEMGKSVIDAYYWNALRLSADARNLFMKLVKDEMQKLQADVSLHASLPDIFKEELKRLLDDDYFKQCEGKDIQVREKVRKVFEKGKCVGGFLLIGAGNYGKNMVDLQVLLGDVIIDICDNNSKIFGRQIGRYTVKNLAELVLSNRDAQWLITTSKYNEEIKEQLISSDVPEQNITMLNKVPLWMSFV